MLCRGMVPGPCIVAAPTLCPLLSCAYRLVPVRYRVTPPSCSFKLLVWQFRGTAIFSALTCRPVPPTAGLSLCICGLMPVFALSRSVVPFSNPKLPPIAKFAEFLSAEKNSASWICRRILFIDNPPKKTTDIRIIKWNQHSNKWLSCYLKWIIPMISKLLVGHCKHCAKWFFQVIKHNFEGSHT